MKIFVTGYDGYVGSHAVAALTARGAVLSVLVRDAAAAHRAEALGFSPVVADLAAPETLTPSIRASDAVAHFAASDAPAFLPVNRLAIEMMLDQLKPAAAFVTHGGSLVFGEQGRDTPAKLPEFNPPTPLAARAELDKMILADNRPHRRNFIVYGSLVFGGRGAMIPNALARAAAAGDASTYPLPGDAIWSGVHIADWADLISRIVYSDDRGRTPVFAAAQDIAISDAAAAIGRALVPSKPAQPVTLDEARGLYPFFADALSIFQRFDGTDAADRFGWQPEQRNLEFAAAEAANAVGSFAPPPR